MTAPADRPVERGKRVKVIGTLSFDVNELRRMVHSRDDQIARLKQDRAEAHEALEQAQSCILDETPEDMSREEAREDTIAKIRTVLRRAPRSGAPRR